MSEDTIEQDIKTLIRQNEEYLALFRTVVEELKPAIDALSDSPVLKMLGVKL